MPDSSGTDTWTPQRIRALGVVTDLATAAKILRLSRSHAYDLAHRGLFPVPVIRAGTRMRVPVQALLAALCLDQPEPPLDDTDTASVDHQQESAASPASAKERA